MKSARDNDPRLPRDGEIQLKVWLDDTARALGIKTNTLVMRMKRGKYPKPQMRVVNPRVIYVTS